MTNLGNPTDNFSQHRQYNDAKKKCISAAQYFFGESYSVANFFLKQQGIGDTQCDNTLFHRLRDYILNKDRRNLYVEHAVNYLKNKPHDICEMYDVIIIGAGIHAATYMLYY